MEQFGPAAIMEGSRLMANIVATPPEFGDLFSDF
jgi:hypothetical protein